MLIKTKEERYDQKRDQNKSKTGAEEALHDAGDGELDCSIFEAAKFKL